MESQLFTGAVLSYMHGPSAPVTKGQICIAVPKIFERGLTQGGG